jgi:EAL domain-containing protein (putative c-di-GMP-specific phosphodiesterase class I)
VQVLLVDDDDLLRTTYETLLKDMAFEVDTASRADEALQRVASKSYDVVLSDIQMPGMSGLEFLKAVRQTDLDVPVILMTGAPSIESAIEAVEYGAFRYLPKPVSAAVLEETAKRAGRYHTLARLKREALTLAGQSANWPSDRAALESRFESALDKLWMAFQPIVSCRQRSVHAYEALLRSDEPTLRSPGDFLQAAEQLARLDDLGRCIRRYVGNHLGRIPENVRVFVNLHPLDLNDPQLLDPASALARGGARVVYEITERASLHGVAGLSEKIRSLRAMGHLLALDDLGAGYAGLTSMAQLEPEYVKLDMSLIRGIDHQPTQQKLVRSMVNLCQELDKKVIAEGVENAAERDTLVDMGCDLLQGYFFAKPARDLPDVAWG